MEVGVPFLDSWLCFSSLFQDSVLKGEEKDTKWNSLFRVSTSESEYIYLSKKDLSVILSIDLKLVDKITCL